MFQWGYQAWNCKGPSSGTLPSFALVDGDRSLTPFRKIHILVENLTGLDFQLKQAGLVRFFEKLLGLLWLPLVNHFGFYRVCGSPSSHAPNVPTTLKLVSF